MKKKIITTALLLFCFFAVFATIENLNGRWTGTLKTDEGEEYPLLYNFKIDGDKITGTAKTPKGDMPINDGKITGDTFTFNVIVNKMEIDHSGKFYGDSVGVDISLGDARSHATLKRAAR
ncbi:MAG: hypothetical protein ACHQIM_08710 [Sphingobacteriales bacterium]